MEIKSTIGQKLSWSKVAVRISILLLALGFSLLGLLSLVNKHQVCSETGVTLENALSIIGGASSFLLGGIFLIAGALDWGRSLSPA
jgi:hypothetical protein